jgi:hypothetical protein
VPFDVHRFDSGRLRSRCLYFYYLFFEDSPSSHFQDNYVPHTPGIQRMLFLLGELITKLDSMLHC